LLSFLKSIQEKPDSGFEKASVTQVRNMRVTENSIAHLDRAVRSLMMRDLPERSMWMDEFSDIHVFCACVMLGFF
jgi:hypothetical protein